MTADWVRTTLGKATEFISGGTPSKARPDYWNGSTSWLSAKDMKRFRVHDTEDHISDAALSDGARVMPPDTVFLLARGMTLLNDVPICVGMRPMAFNQDVKALQPKAGVNDAFLPYLLLGHKERLLSLVDLAGHGTGRLNSADLNALEIDLPPLAEQRAIASILGAIDDKIELSRQMNETLEAMARALFKSWFVDFDPVRAKAEGGDPGAPQPIADLFPDRLEDSELGEIPEGWRVQTIGDLANVLGGGTPSTLRPDFWKDGSHCWATPKDLAVLASPVLLDTERHLTDSGLTQVSSSLLPRGTVLLSSRAPIGYLAIAEIPTAINQGFIAMVPNGSAPSVFLLLWAHFANDEILSRANGSTFLEISKSNFRPIPVVRPTEAVFAAFETLAGPFHQRMVANVREAHALAAVRDALLPKLISGNVRVRDAESVSGERA